MPAHPANPPHPSKASPPTRADAATPRRLLISAGPTHEPIDAVRYIGNRSSGRLGIALADEAARRERPGGGPEWDVTLLLGPTPLNPSRAADAHSQPRVRRFLTTTDLRGLLAEEFPACDALIMAAAVADYRPKPRPAGEAGHDGKIKRGDGPLVLELEPTPDLLAEVARGRRPGQLVVGFALEPRARLIESARSKLARKGLDLIVANPLETMDAPTIHATVLGPDGPVHTSEGEVGKESFARTLIDLVSARVRAQTVGAGAR